METMEKVLVTIGIVFLVSVLVIGLAALWALVTWWAWNIVIPYLFGLKTISLIQAFALNLLAAAFFKSTTSLNCKK
jgi:hypothetical protein